MIIVTSFLKEGHLSSSSGTSQRLFKIVKDVGWIPSLMQQIISFVRRQSTALRSATQSKMSRIMGGSGES